MKKRILPLVMIVLLAVGTGLWYYHRVNGLELAKELTVYGNVDIRQVQLAFHATGRIQSLTVQEGDGVKAGQQVAEIDPIRYEASLARAEALAGVRIVPSQTLPGKVLFSPLGIRCFSTNVRNGIGTPSSASGITGARNACPKMATGTHAICTGKVLARTSSNLPTTVLPRGSATKIFALSGRS